MKIAGPFCFEGSILGCAEKPRVEEFPPFSFHGCIGRLCLSTDMAIVGLATRSVLEEVPVSLQNNRAFDYLISHTRTALRSKS